MTSGAEDCYKKALELLARRPHFRREIRAKLEARRFPQDAVESALERLVTEGYLDDLTSARELATGPLHRKGYGPRRTRHELERRGAPEEVIDEVMATVWADGDLEQARQVAARWRDRGVGESGALARHLDRKGFSKATILTILEESSDSTDARSG